MIMFHVNLQGCVYIYILYTYTYFCGLRLVVGPGDFSRWASTPAPTSRITFLQGGDVENYMRNQRKKTGKDDFKPPAQALRLERFWAKILAEILYAHLFFIYSALEAVPPRSCCFLVDLFLVLALAQRRHVHIFGHLKSTPCAFFRLVSLTIHLRVSSSVTL